jgi:peptidoglycan/LPS O-acetylase OafA/YrhL
MEYAGSPCLRLSSRIPWLNAFIPASAAWLNRHILVIALYLSNAMTSEASIGALYGLGLTHLWSLCCEEHFYLVWPWLVRCTSIAGLKRVLIAIVVLSPALRLTQILSGGNLHNVYALSFNRFDGFAFGGFAALIHLGHVRVRPRYTLVALSVSAVILVLIFMINWRSTTRTPLDLVVGITAVSWWAQGLILMSITGGASRVWRWPPWPIWEESVTPST